MKKIGELTDNVKNALSLSAPADRNIYIGDTNIQHMEKAHPEDYKKYKDEIKNILENPDYVGLNKNDDSIEYVKEIQHDDEFIKVAVRVSSAGRLYARSLYVLNNQRVKNFISKGTLKKC